MDVFNLNNTTLLRLPEALAIAGVSRSTFYKQVKAGLQPSPISISHRSTLWLKHELEAVLSARISGMSDDEIKQLNSRVILTRKKAK